MRTFLTVSDVIIVGFSEDAIVADLDCRTARNSLKLTSPDPSLSTCFTCEVMGIKARVQLVRFRWQSKRCYELTVEHKDGRSPWPIPSQAHSPVTSLGADHGVVPRLWLFDICPDDSLHFDALRSGIVR